MRSAGKTRNHYGGRDKMFDVQYCRPVQIRVRHAGPRQASIAPAQSPWLPRHAGLAGTIHFRAGGAAPRGWEMPLHRRAPPPFAHRASSAHVLALPAIHSLPRQAPAQVLAPAMRKRGSRFPPSWAGPGRRIPDTSRPTRDRCRLPAAQRPAARRLEGEFFARDATTFSSAGAKASQDRTSASTRPSRPHNSPAAPANPPRTGSPFAAGTSRT